MGPSKSIANYGPDDQNVAFHVIEPILETSDLHVY